MIEFPLVTVIGAVRNARTATRLTYASFHRHTPEPVRLFIADNGSTDGVLDDLRKLDWLTVYSLDERQRLAEREAVQARSMLADLDARLDAFAAEMPAAQRAVLEALRSRFEVVVPDDEDLCQHSTTLDWLVTKVETPYFLLLDSDVEFIETGWLTDLVEFAERAGLGAVGEYEPGRFPCRPRLATYLMLVRTATFQSLAVPFRHALLFGDPEEERRWYSRPRGRVLDPSAFDGFATAAFYDTAALLFEEMCQRGVAWRSFPPAIAAKFRHLGQMTWSTDTGADYAGGDRLREHVRAANAYARRRLAERYDGGPPEWPPM